MNDPLTYGPNGIRCGCGKDAHSNLVPCQPDRPYTDDDLRAEAARIHRQFTAQPDEGLVGEVMESGHVPSVETSDDGSARTWPELLEPDGEETPEYAQAQRAVTDLIRGAADVSRWAIDLGAEGLEPTAHTLSLDSTKLGGEFARLHLAFHPDVPEDDRARFTAGLRQAIDAHLS